MLYFSSKTGIRQLYKSNIFPWSNVLTGSQGTAPSDNFDPLEYGLRVLIKGEWNYMLG